MVLDKIKSFSYNVYVKGELTPEKLEIKAIEDLCRRNSSWQATEKPEIDTIESFC